MDFLDDTLCKMSKGFECLKSTANMGLGFCCSVGEAALNRGKNWRRSGKARTSLCLFRSLFTFHFSLDLSFHFFSLRPLSYAVFIQIIFTQSCFNLCWQYCVRVTQDKLWSCELHGNWIQVQTVRRREMRTNPQNEINENARKPKLKSQYVSRQNYLKIKLKSWVQRPKEDPVSITIRDTSLQEPEARKPKYKVRKTYFLRLGQGPEYSYPNLWMYLFL